jgi:starch phosphorylase
VSNEFQPRSWAGRVPSSLSKLVDLAYDLRWIYDSEIRRLFEQIDGEEYLRLNGNPVALLQQVTVSRLSDLASDAAYIQAIDSCWEPSMAPNATPAVRQTGQDSCMGVAYFCAEYALSEVLPFYSGGLGVLAGDHFKSAADIGLPFVAVGLAYRDGYFRQTIDRSGCQVVHAEKNDFETMPMELMRVACGERLKVQVPLRSGTIEVQVWQIRLGHNRLFLLDTDVEANSTEDRAITGTLYGGDTRTRIQQEIVLGLGGVRALLAMGIEPTVFHMNEGHAAFMVLERLANACASERTFDAAFDLCRKAHVFTTHTPVPAGFDVFSASEMATYLPDMHTRLGVSREALLLLGGPIDGSPGEDDFNMAYLAMRASARINGVSKLHGNVSRGMWQTMWPNLSVDDVPITHVTNGVHVPTWQAAGWRCLEPSSVDNSTLWAQRNDSRSQLVTSVRARVRTRASRLGDEDSAWVDNLLDPDVLTIGFARRFATYKRATLLLRQEERLKALLLDSERPVQFLFAGKAHPRDVGGQDLIKDVVKFASQPSVRTRFQFLEGYDMALGRELVAGVDVWLNNPRRPKEASGTSGMKVVLNGGLNLSVLDGWWDEAYDGQNGWSIGAGEFYDDPEEADVNEAELLLTLLEQEVVPAFYERSAAGLPESWLAKVRHSMAGLSYRFSTERMVRDYARELYTPTHESIYKAPFIG